MSSFYLKKWISTEIQSWAKLRHKAVLYPMESHRVSFLCVPSFPSVYTISAMFESYRTIGQTRKGEFYPYLPMIPSSLYLRIAELVLFLLAINAV